MIIPFFSFPSWFALAPSGESHELQPSTVDAPAIVVHLCEDPVGFGTHGNLVPKQKIVGTRRPGPSNS